MPNRPSSCRKKQENKKIAVLEDIALVALQQVETLDELIAKFKEVSEESIPTHLLTHVIRKELTSTDLTDFLLETSAKQPGKISLNELASVLKNVPRKLYFFLWSLQNSDVIPTRGILTSAELRRALLALVKFLRMLNRFALRSPNSIPIFEHLGYVYLDLAGLVQYSKKGFKIAGKLLDRTRLLRLAVASFQKTIKLDAEHGREIDSSHLSILGLLDNKVDLKARRLHAYLNPWHFLYISSALKHLNDKKIANIYLHRACSIISILDDHQNSKLRQQKALLESVYSSIHYGEHLKFDFSSKSLIKIQRKLNMIQRRKKNENGYSPVVERALSHELQMQRLFMTEGKLQSEHKAYLRAINQLYHEPVSPLDRDKLIYRLNIPPVRLSGLRNKVNTFTLKSGY